MNLQKEFKVLNVDGLAYPVLRPYHTLQKSWGSAWHKLPLGPTFCDEYNRNPRNCTRTRAKNEPEQAGHYKMPTSVGTSLILFDFAQFIKRYKGLRIHLFLKVFDSICILLDRCYQVVHQDAFPTFLVRSHVVHTLVVYRHRASHIRG